jgi:cytochrome c biogenesis factor
VGNVKKKVDRANDSIGLFITNLVGTMWCAYIFCAISLSSLKSTLDQHSINADVQWVAQTFLQLVLLSIIMVGQNVQSKRAEEHAQKLDALHAKVDGRSDGAGSTDPSGAPTADATPPTPESDAK